MLTIAGYAMQEALRRKVFAVVLLLTTLFLGLYAAMVTYVFREVKTVPADVNVDVPTFVGATLFGLALFATLFLGVVLAVFLTLGVVRGDAERGLLQPLVVRPIGRVQLLAARFLGSAGVCVGYVLAVYFAAMAITGGIGHWWPDRIATPGIEVAGAVVVVVGLSLLGSVFLSATANGIAIFMLFGGGLVGGLLGTVGHAVNSQAVKHAAVVTAWVLPFEALYQDALREITLNATGLEGFLLQLGPLGGAYVHGWSIRLWSAAYLLLVGGVALVAFRRRDL
jgi:Cu-processing system permease protein